ncbi:ketoacyl-ACP synthase III [Demequina sp. TTPB684]|uniref:beta-ketoacyl-ACP synthase III n=1 Tax=unclassified Demequina TaxID=2620311 RepID=UPI001CF40886|nr:MULTISPECIES: beta-ketoacyl-ACP synthase III [unclassified Demequina]MCB2414051.1 ketoacyl-ACP synthase III [Demequina sp. TTPB684]UPU89070.1 ketoacyl-ACP synthase III [Demequina sp. TMPB413]
MTVIRTTKGPEFSRIRGLGVFRGEMLVPNEDIIEPINSSDEWIRKMTGIATRVRANPETTVIDMAEAASRQAIENAGIDADEIDAVILSTITFPHITPGGAPVVADRLGITAAAFDISAACAGYCYGIGQADSLVRSGQARNVLVIGAEKMSEFIDPADRSISYLLGDAAGAVVVGASDTPAIGPTVWGSDGAGAHLVRQTASWLEYRDNPGTPFPTLFQEGPSVYKWASFKMAPVALEAIAAAGVTPTDIKAFIPHQANIRIIDQMVKQIGLPEHVAIARDIVDSGNTSAASIPLATERLLRDGAVQSGDLALQIGFGAGLVYAAQVVVLP